MSVSPCLPARPLLPGFSWFLSSLAYSFVTTAVYETFCPRMTVSGLSCSPGHGLAWVSVTGVWCPEQAFPLFPDTWCVHSWSMLCQEEALEKGGGFSRVAFPSCSHLLLVSQVGLPLIPRSRSHTSYLRAKALRRSPRAYGVQMSLYAERFCCPLTVANKRRGCVAPSCLCSLQPLAIISASVPCPSLGRLPSTPYPISNMPSQASYPPIWMVSCPLHPFLLQLWQWVPSREGSCFIFVYLN